MDVLPIKGDHQHHVPVLKSSRNKQQMTIMTHNTNEPSKAHGNLSAATGAVKENVGAAFGNRSMQAKGAAERAEGNAEIQAAKAKGYIEGVVNDVSGTVKNATGQVLGNESLRAKGE